MPTGYTYELLEKDLAFKDFAMLCARAFGALVTLRDDPISKPAPDAFEISDYHQKELAKATKDHARLTAMSQPERLAFGRKKQRERIRDLTESRQKDVRTNEKLSAMIKQAEAWKPPTSEHNGLREFMIDQCRISMETFKYTDEELEKLKCDPIELWKQAVDSAIWQIDYHTKQHGEEVSRTASRNAWIKSLRLSLGLTPPTPASERQER